MTHSLLIDAAARENGCPQKKCFKCGAMKPLTEFYKHPRMTDGHLGKCKACTKNDVADNYRSSIDAKREYEATRRKTPERIAARAEYTRRARNAHPEKFRAHQTVKRAIASGKLTVQTCEVCGKNGTQAHHDDYSKPLEVRWLCFVHHQAVHGHTAVTQPSNVLRKTGES